MTDVAIADPQLGAAEREAVAAVLESGMLADGPRVRAFEEAFSDYCGAEHGVATSNGTTALHAALVGLGIGPGDTVVVPAFTFAATANAVRLAGADVAFADVDPETYTVDVGDLDRVAAATDADAVVPVHLFGLPAPMEAVAEVAADRDLLVLADAAQAHGAALDGRTVGGFGDAACFSFYPTKNMTTGEGGMVLTDDPGVAERTARFCDHGQTARYEHGEVGHNFRLTSVAAAIGRVQLDRLPEFVERRRANAARLADELADVPALALPVEPGGARHAYNQFTVRHPDRDGLAAHLADRGVDSKVYYPRPVHRQPAYADADADCPTADRLAGEVLSLPVHPGLSDADVAAVADAVASYGGQR